ncbi:MAG: hypothetical protein IJ865_01130 [Clostridia bacterium]|nr:hypothetical protein [Clostridia bacterium]
MNQLANVVFPYVFGWVRTAAASLYGLFTDPNTESALKWVGERWKLLLLVLLAIGTVVDLTVYLFRWRPFEVWASFFRRLTRSRRHTHIQRTREDGVRTVGAVPADDAYIVPASAVRRDPNSLTYLDPQTDIEYEDMTDDFREDVFLEESYAAEETGAMPVQDARRRRSRGNGAKPGRLKAFARFVLGETEEEEMPIRRYAAAQPAVDSREAYNEPYIPPQWKQPEERIKRNKRSHRGSYDE